jgi:hypothetical protein
MYSCRVLGPISESQLMFRIMMCSVIGITGFILQLIWGSWSIHRNAKIGYRDKQRRPPTGHIASSEFGEFPGFQVQSRNPRVIRNWWMQQGIENCRKYHNPWKHRAVNRVYNADMFHETMARFLSWDCRRLHRIRLILKHFDAKTH